MPDIFISYAQDDNKAPLGEDQKQGWVTHFAHNLHIEVGRELGRAEKCVVWRDDKLHGADQVF